MSCLIRTAHIRTLLSVHVKAFLDRPSNSNRISNFRSSGAVPLFLFHRRHYYSSEAIISKSPIEANIIRILRNEIDYQSEYAPPHQPFTEFNSFTVQDRPGEQWITIRGKYGGNEDVKIEVTMFDGYREVPKLGDDSSGMDVRLHLSLLIDIAKGEGGEVLEFLCSAWPDSLQVEKVYMLSHDKMRARPYMGPDFRKLDVKIQKALREYLEARGVNDELSTFLHEYMMNKDKAELIRWLGSVVSFIET